MKAEKEMENREREDRRSVSIAGSSMFFNGICASSGGVIVALLQEHAGMSYAQSGMMLSALSIGQLFSCWLVGFLPAKIGLKKTIWIMSAGLGLGYLLMTGVSALALPILFLSCLCGYFLIGVGKGATLNVANVMSGKTLEPAKNLNLEHAAFAFGSLIGPVIIAGMSAAELAWWTPLLMLSLSGVLLYLVFLSAGLPGKPQTKTAGRAQTSTGGRYSFLKSGKFWLLTSILFCQQCTEIAVTGWLVTYFKDMGILTGAASQMTVTVVWAAMMVGRLFIAFRLKLKNLPRAMMLMGLGCTLTYLAMLTAGNAVAALILLGLFGLSIAGVYPTTIAAAGEMLSNESMGVMLPLAAIGAIAMPSLVGAVAERLGIQAGMLLILISVTGIMLLGGLLGVMEKKWKASAAQS